VQRSSMVKYRSRRYGAHFVACSSYGVTQSTVNNIVSGRNNSVTVSTVKKLCDEFDISVEEFFHSELFRDLEQEVK